MEPFPTGPQPGIWKLLSTGRQVDAPVTWLRLYFKAGGDLKTPYILAFAADGGTRPSRTA